MQDLTDLVNANLETVRKILSYTYQMNSELAIQRVMKGAESNRITKTTNGDDFRAPLVIAPAGLYGAFNPEGGNLGLGVGYTLAQLVQTYFATKSGYQLTYAAVRGTETDLQTRFNAWKETMKGAVPFMARMENVGWHNLGGNNGQVGIVTTTTSVGGGTETFTMDPEFGTRLFIENQRVEIFNSNQSTYRTSTVSPDNLPYVQSINRVARQMVVTNLGSIVPANGDTLFLQGCTSTPVWADGLYYVNTTSTSGSYLRFSRTTYPSINPTAITSGGVLNPQQILALAFTIKIRGGNQQFPTLIGLASPHQLAQMSAQVQAMQVYYRSQMTGPQIDPLPKQVSVGMDQGVLFGDITHYEDDCQGYDRIDYCNPKTWGRVYLDHEGADFYRDPGTNQMFFPMTAAGTNAGPAAGTLFYLETTENWINTNPLLNGLITGLVPPSQDYSF